MNYANFDVHINPAEVRQNLMTEWPLQHRVQHCLPYQSPSKLKQEIRKSQNQSEAKEPKDGQKQNRNAKLLADVL